MEQGLKQIMPLCVRIAFGMLNKKQETITMKHQTYMRKPENRPQISRQTGDKLTIMQHGKAHDFDYLKTPGEFSRYYVYFVFFNLELIYIGKGTGDRWKHTKSLSTHNPFIRYAIKHGRIHKDPAFYKTYIVKNDLPEENALWLEQTFISQFRPIGNIDENPYYMNEKKGHLRLFDNLCAFTDINPKTSKKSHSTVKRCMRRKSAKSKKEYIKQVPEMLDLEHINQGKGIYF